MSFPAWLDQPLARAIEELVPECVCLRVRVVDEAGDPALFDATVSLEVLTEGEILERYLLDVAARRLDRQAAGLRIERAIASYMP